MAWFGSYLAVLAIGLVGLLLVVGFAAGVGTAVSAGDGSYIWDLFAGTFGAIMDHPQWVRNLVPMAHTGQPPLDGISWPATVFLLAVAAGLVAAGLAGFRRRDLETK